MATYLQRTPSTLGDRTKWTISMWYKRTSLSNFYLTSCNNSSNYSTFYVTGGGQLRYYNYWSGAIQHELKTNRLFRDTNAWYHIVMAWDSTLATANDRFKFYVNGVQETSFATRTNPPQNEGSFFNVAGYNHRVAAEDTTSGGQGLLSHVHFTDGYAYNADTFGETDATTGEWKIKTSPSVTYGTNGFFILKDGNSVTDQSGNGNNFTVGGGTLTKTEDCPSNVFATINPLVPYSSNLDFHEGNTTVENDGSSANWTTRWGVSTLGMSSGKFYAEAKVANIGTNQMYALGLAKDVGTFTPTSSVGANGLAYYSTGNIYNGISGQDQTGLASYTTNDIIGLAIDATNGSAQWYKNGSAIGNAETIATDGTWFFVTNFYTNGRVNVNYGNGYFGTTAVSSAGTNASGNGIFEYDVPTGYTALSTKGLNL